MNPITMKLVVDDLILQALREDITFEDVSTASVCPTARPATVELIAKADGIIAGLDVFARTFELLDSLARRGLTRVDEHGLGALERRGHLVRIGGNAAHALQVVERHALA